MSNRSRANTITSTSSIDEGQNDDLNMTLDHTLDDEKNLDHFQNTQQEQSSQNTQQASHCGKFTWIKTCH